MKLRNLIATPCMNKPLLIHGDCIEEMKKIDNNSVDSIITDIPYGITACKWDTIIDLGSMWEQLNRIIKSNGAIVLFGSEPFSSVLRMSNIKNYKYDWIWNKQLKTGHLNAKKMPMLQHELIHIFGKGRINYYPIMENGKPLHGEGKRKNKTSNLYSSEHVCKDIRKGETNKYPSSLSINFQKIHSSKTIHPTQKPVALMEYLIKTYTNENETVLDFTMGSFTTAIACINTKRYFIGIELDEHFFKIGENRVNEHIKTLDYKLNL